MHCCARPKNDGVLLDTKDDRKEAVSLLLLGAGDVGKSTFIRQIRLLHGKPFDKAELQKFSLILPLNTLASMKALVNACVASKMKIDSKLKKKMALILESDTLTQPVAAAIDSLWHNESVHEVFQRRSELKAQIPTNAAYYFDNVKRFVNPDFVASHDDIFHCKLKTTGTQELRFDIGGRLFSITDVGGQRSERRKWLFVFAGVRAVIFLAALDEYDLVLEEDEKTNRFTESLDLFRTVTGSQFLEKSSWILFLNKSDALKAKLPRYPLNLFFNDISEDDGANFDAAVKYLHQKFMKAWKGKTELFHFVTCNLDTTLTEKTFQSVRAMIVTDALEDAGF